MLRSRSVPLTVLSENLFLVPSQDIVRMFFSSHLSAETCVWMLVVQVSADMAHGVHPNFADKHEENHRPQLHKGLVIKHNANQRYATSGITSFLFKEVAKLHGLPIQVRCSLKTQE